MYIYIYIYIYVYIFTYVYTYVYTYIHVYRYVCIYIYVLWETQCHKQLPFGHGLCGPFMVILTHDMNAECFDGSPIIEGCWTVAERLLNGCRTVAEQLNIPRLSMNNHHISSGKLTVC